MMKRNTLVAATGLLVAAAAVGTGAMVTRDAMASGVGQTVVDEMTLGMIGADATAVQCTFTGADVLGLLPTDASAIPVTPAVPADEQVIIGVVPEMADQTLPADGTPPAGAETFTAEAPVPGVGSDQGFAVTDIRNGTPAECDAMRAAVLGMADWPVESSGRVAGISGTEPVTP